MSSSGVLQHVGPEVYFTSIEKWEEEFKMYCTLMRIKTFFYFRMWKAFFVWRKGIIFKKISNARKYLDSNLFILNPLLRSSLLDIQHMCCEMSTTTFTDVTKVEDWPLFYFIEAQVCTLKNFYSLVYENVLQMDKLETVMAKVREFRSVAKEIVSNACYGALLARGFIVDETQVEPGKI